MIVIRTLVSIVLLPGVVAVLIPWRLIGSASVPSGVAWLGLLPLLSGIALSAWCVVLFATRGHGTPAPWDAPRQFVATGPYRVVRNPMYLAVGSVIAGEAILFASWTLAAYVVVIAVVWRLFVVLYEEPTLARQFGESYAAYRAHVPRWIPRLP